MKRAMGAWTSMPLMWQAQDSDHGVVPELPSQS